jgi:quercetin dioxygenase-like cupin family protein
VIRKVTLKSLPRMNYTLPQGIEVCRIFEGENYMVSYWRGAPALPLKDKPHRHDGYGVIEETIILLKGKMRITARDEAVVFEAGEAVSYWGNETHQSEILEPVEALMIVGPPVKVRTSGENVEYLKKEESLNKEDLIS